MPVDKIICAWVFEKAASSLCLPVPWLYVTVLFIHLQFINLLKIERSLRYPE